VKKHLQRRSLYKHTKLVSCRLEINVQNHLLSQCWRSLNPKPCRLSFCKTTNRRTDIDRCANRLRGAINFSFFYRGNFRPSNLSMQEHIHRSPALRQNIEEQNLAYITLFSRCNCNTLRQTAREIDLTRIY
jgi:hypothetical protein